MHVSEKRPRMDMMIRLFKYRYQCNVKKNCIKKTKRLPSKSWTGMLVLRSETMEICCCRYRWLGLGVGTSAVSHVIAPWRWQAGCNRISKLHGVNNTVGGCNIEGLLLRSIRFWNCWGEWLSGENAKVIFSSAGCNHLQANDNSVIQSEYKVVGDRELLIILYSVLQLCGCQGFLDATKTIPVIFSDTVLHACYVLISFSQLAASNFSRA